MADQVLDYINQHCFALLPSCVMCRAGLSGAAGLTDFADGVADLVVLLMNYLALLCAVLLCAVLQGWSVWCCWFDRLC
jgi:hypothetical protein